MYKFLFAIGLMLVTAFAATAQIVDTTVAGKADTVRKASNTAPGSFAPPIKKEKTFKPDSLHSPHKAVMHSLMVPGWGQLYNRRWWKVPIIYGGIGLLVSAVIFNQKYYNQDIALARYRKQGIAPNKGDKYYDIYQLYELYKVPDQSIYSELDGYRRNRDLSILGILGAWGIQTIDAYIDAKFIHSYTVDNNLSMKVTPGIMGQPVYAQSANSTFIPTVKITFTF
ncbi:DUF5683 domain-containing protein [Mucilaginibacter sabulilitoris]|uniref:DUF5683 domain-containing protein n=1 Tax=Mucilaginibacter sabulilitoris TaxID=1173583 RepID=A0ABZ0TPL2_9SPHI|nr:DUF5683 domain-containing protein [Mucilaginibacter sabulilitoris]WPU95084.1 DUF5683 domain-containing protein [Mucilaginibacter sabulilitoris]